MRFFALAALVFVFAGGFAQAETYGNLGEALRGMNRIKPLQHPSYDRAQEILGRRILDDKKRVIGEVNDVILMRSGNIASLMVRFDRLRLADPVMVNYHDMGGKPVSKGYSLAFTGREIEERFPEMLANIETAAGADSDVVSLKTLPGTSVQSADGRNIGKIEDVLFAADGERAEALYINISYGTLRGQAVAIPFSLGQLQEVQNTPALVLSNADADTVMAFVRSR
ncbi:MAG: PRC-barrel domain-containing protein [Alphaproteobacteria bacterium]|nr:PRC-barrel domain-containing protein [Alphaproteobacteria bacterium]